MYNVDYTQEAIEDLKRLQKNEPKIFDKARREYANGETISCRTPEEMQRYFDSL